MAIRTAIDRFLRVEHNKPFLIVGSPVFSEANLVLDSFIKDFRKTGKIGVIINKKSITEDQLQHIFETGELGQADSMDPSQLQKIVWFYVLCFFEKRGRESQCRQLEQWMLVLKRKPIGREYYELNRVVPGAIPMTKNQQGGLKDNEDESGKNFCLPKLTQVPHKNVKELPLSSQSTSCCLVPTPKVSLKPKLQPSSESNLVR